MRLNFFRLVFALCVGLALSVSTGMPPASAQELAHEHGVTAKDTQCRLGDYLCNHDYFHPVYVLLELITGRSCCHNSEGRPTRDIEELNPEDETDKKQIAAGFAYKVWVDGQWCPASREALMQISPRQKALFMEFKQTRANLFYSFMEYDHAFAPKSASAPDGKILCPVLYCLYKKYPPG